MCKSPFALMSRSTMPWRATCSSMWSRKGTPVASSARPSPSRFTETEIFVSAVLRSAAAVRIGGGSSLHEFGERRPQRLEQPVVLGRRADREAQAVAHHGMPREAFDEHALAPQALEG